MTPSFRSAVRATSPAISLAISLAAVSLTALPFRSVAAQAQSPAVPAAATLTAGDTGTAVHPPSPRDVSGVPGESTVRIVRLSQVQGGVELDRGTGEAQPAFENLPVVQGSRLATGMGLAEIEFEDNSSLRLTPNTTVEFPHLALRPDGSKVTVVRVIRGTVYASMADGKGDEITLDFGSNRVSLPRKSHIELSVTPEDTRLRVLNGSVQAVAPGGTVTVNKKKMAVFAAGDSAAAPEVADNRGDGSYDRWDKRAVEYHGYRAAAAFAGQSSFAGVSDLAYYGSFVNLGGGCGTLWQPYFVGAGWSPFSNGTWALYPGAGYSWVSPYPWGWAPFHSGSWMNCGGAGWGWRPGGSWYGLRNAPINLAGNTFNGGASAPGGAAGGGGLHGPLMPRPPLAGTGHLPANVVVNARPLQASTFDHADGSFVFRQGSGGMGIPRQSLGRLGGVSREAAQSGGASRIASPSGVSSSAGAALVGGNASATATRAGAGPAHSNALSGARSQGSTGANYGGSGAANGGRVSLPGAGSPSPGRTSAPSAPASPRSR